jgi:hypothetical protein
MTRGDQWNRDEKGADGINVGLGTSSGSIKKTNQGLPQSYISMFAHVHLTRDMLIVGSRYSRCRCRYPIR